MYLQNITAGGSVWKHQRIDMHRTLTIGTIPCLIFWVDPFSDIDVSQVVKTHLPSEHRQRHTLGLECWALVVGECIWHVGAILAHEAYTHWRTPMLLRVIK